MVQTLSSLAFRGSIAEAITEAKQQKKLFVVYVSGDNLDSNKLETSTWTDSSVADSVLKFCILVHISEGTVDAANFSAIFPQKSAPCITVIGYNGIQLWQNEGFVAADVLVSSIEKAWLSLHIQETTSTLFTAGLASQSHPASGTSSNALTGEGSSSRTDVMLSQTGLQEKNFPESAVKETESEIRDQTSTDLSMINEFDPEVVHEVTSCNETAKSLPGPPDGNSTKDESLIQKENVGLADHISTDQEVSQVIANEGNQGLQETMKGVVSPEVVIEANEALEVNRCENVVEIADVVDATANKSNDVHLNVRLPDGSSLQVKFSVMDNLRVIKDYVDESKSSSFGSYDLAIPYPRKVFTEEDLGQTLLELGLSNRQTLMVVLHRRANSHHNGGRSTVHGFNQDSSPIRSNEGYWAYMKRVLSYINPFSYLAESSNSSETAQESENSTLQHGVNASVRNNLGASGTYSSNGSSTPTSGGGSRLSMQQSSSRFGGNIHTLKHDEDDSKFSDRNAYWNGNSTQFGGDNDGK